jgi:hypothetical protein
MLAPLLALALLAQDAASVRALIEKDAWREALDAAKAYAAASPNDPEARSALGEALYRAGRIAEAGTTLAPLAGGDAPPPRALATLGLVRAAEGRNEEAGTLLDRAVALAPEDRFVLYHAASVGTSRADSIARLERYLAKSDGDDADRIEGARGTIRYLKALGDRATWVRETSPERVEVPLRAIPDGSGGCAGFVVQVEAGGRKLWVLLDTGSGGFFAVERAMRKTGIEPISEETVFAGGGAGREASKKGFLPSFAIGGLRFKDAVATTTPNEIDPVGRYQGVLGIGIFSGYRVTLDLAKGRLVLDAGELPGGAVPYWDVAGQILVEATGGDGRRGLFLFDTGAARSFLSFDFAGGPSGARADVRTYGGAVEGARQVLGVALEFPGLPPSAKPKMAGDLTQRSRLSGVEVSGFLGLDLLDGAVVVVDTKSRRIAASRPSKK